jgi:hypothetical protein
MAFCRVGRCLRLGKQRKLRRFGIVPLHQSQICETTLPRNLGQPTQLNSHIFTTKLEPLTDAAITSPRPLVLPQGSRDGARRLQKARMRKLPRKDLKIATTSGVVDLAGPSPAVQELAGEITS